ncbi:MAG: tetratricopeptide repeat protein [Acidobacteriota bacterium]
MGKVRWLSGIVLVLLSVLMLRSVCKEQIAQAIVEGYEMEGALSTALVLSPHSSEAHFKLGRLYLYNPEKRNLDSAILHLEKAAQLSPYSYRVWLELGKAREQAGLIEAARTAFARSSALAPKSFEALWARANFLLRNAEAHESIWALRQAIELQPASLPLALELAYQKYGNSLTDTEKIVPTDLLSRLNYALFLVNVNQPTAAVTLVSEIAGKGFEESHYALLRQIVDTLYQKRYFSEAKTVWLYYAQANAPQLGVATLESVFNGSFDYSTQLGYFDWSIPQINGVEISELSTHNNGLLRLVFNKKNVDLYGPAQVIPVRAGKSYRLSFRKHSQALFAAGQIFVEVYDVVDYQRLNLASTPLKSDEPWNTEELSFTTTAETNAIVLRVRRPKLNKFDSLIEGVAEFDDFQLISQ